MLFNLEKEALFASGIRDEKQIQSYDERLHKLYTRFVSDVAPSDDPLIKAGHLFNWLWETKPGRYRMGGSYRLSEVIDRQMDRESQAVGNCLGLTVLYNCLLRKINWEPKALYLPNAFGISPHVLTLLETGGSTIEIENIFPNGFDYKGHVDSSMKTMWGDKELVSDVYHSRGNEDFKKGDFSEALKNYKKALKLNSKHPTARLNIIILLEKKKMGKNSGMDYPSGDQ